MDNVELAVREVLKNNCGKMNAVLIALTIYEILRLGKQAIHLVKEVKI